MILLSCYSLIIKGQNIDLNKYDVFINDSLISKSDFMEKSGTLDSLRLRQLQFKPVKDGYKKAYYLNGRLYSEGIVKNGKEDGLWIYWHDNGKKAREGNFVQGKREGIHKYWFLNGRMRGEGSFKNDKYDGKWLMYKEDSQEVVEQVYKNGELVH